MEGIWKQKRRKEKLNVQVFQKNIPNEELNLQKSVNFLTLPRKVGTHPETKKKLLHLLVRTVHT